MRNSFSGRKFTSNISKVMLACLFIFAAQPRTTLAAPELAGISITRNGNFVSQLYRDLLGRSAGKAEILSGASALRGATSRSAVVSTLVTSTEYRTAQIEDFCTTLLDRSTQTSELTVFLEFLSAGGNISQVQGNYIGTDEYLQSQAGGTANGFISAIFQDLLGRSPAASEQASFQQLLRNGTRQEAAEAILGSTEYFTNLVNENYQQFLRRAPSAAEVSLWVSQLDSGATRESFQTSLLSSDEYFLIPTAGFTAGHSVFLGSVAGFSDSDTSRISSDFTADINWGDGESSDAEIVPGRAGLFGVFGSHSYQRGGTFDLSIVLTGPDGRSRAHSSITIQAQLTSFRPFRGGGGVRVAVGDVNGDGIQDIVTGTGAGRGATVKVFDGLTKALKHNFLAYDATFKGGIFVAAGDLNDDGRADIITGPGKSASGGPNVKVFSGETGELLSSFFAYDVTFGGGVQVAAGDVNLDGIPDIITGSGAGGPPHVKVFSGEDLSLLQSFFAYDTTFTGGVFVAAGDVNGDGRADIVTGPGAGSSGNVKVFSGLDNSLLTSFLVFNSGQVRVAAGDVNGDGIDDIIGAAGPGKAPVVKVRDGLSNTLIESFLAFSGDFKGGVFVAAGDIDGDGSVSIVSGAGSGLPAIKIRRF